MELRTARTERFTPEQKKRIERFKMHLWSSPGTMMQIMDAEMDREVYIEMEGWLKIVSPEPRVWGGTD